MPPIARILAATLLSVALASLSPPAVAAAVQPRAAAPALAQATSPRPATAKPGAPEAAATAKPKPLRNPSFYTAEVTLSSQNEKRAGMARALAQVVVRLTGDPKAASNNVVRRASSNVEALVSSSSVKQDSDLVNGVPVYKTVLTVNFDPDAVDALVSGSGLRYWSGARPKPILWLAIDDGRGPRLVTGKQTAVVKPLASRGLERGMRYLLPAGTAAEQAALRSIIGLNSIALQPLTARYGNDTQLLGKVYRQPPGWAADWVMSQGGVEVARWSYSDADPRRVIASGVDEGANALAARDSVKIDTGVAGLHNVEVIGVNSQAQYLRVMSYLQTLAIVRRVLVTEAMPGQLRLQLDLSVGMRGFRTMVAASGTLRELSEPPVEGAPSTGVPRFGLQ